MQESDEQDTCRICSAPAEPGQPLFHPCKCSGTIRYIHQDCLTTWLAHSKKKTCDVCKHPYSFTKVYAPNMPSHLPPLLLIRRLIQQLFFAILFVIRAIAVAIIWLAVLPWVTFWTWRMYFAMGESTAWWISNRPRPDHNETSFLFQRVRYEGVYPADKNLLGRIAAHPAWISISADIFTGQIIAALIVLTFVAVFLLREWISQNARPGVFEDEDMVADDQVNPPPLVPDLPLAQPIQPLALEGFPEANLLAQRQQDAVRALDALRARDFLIDHQAPPHHELAAQPPIHEPINGQDKGKQRDDGETLKRPRLVNLPLEESEILERMKQPEYKRKVKMARVLAAKRRAMANQHESNLPSLLPQDQSNFDFTFKAAPRPSDADRQDSDSQPDWLSEASSSSQASQFRNLDSAFFPPVSLQPPREDIPFSIRAWNADVGHNSPLNGHDSLSEPPVHSSQGSSSSTSTFALPSRYPLALTPEQPPDPLSCAAVAHPLEESEPEAGPSYSSHFSSAPTPDSRTSKSGDVPALNITPSSDNGSGEQPLPYADPMDVASEQLDETRASHLEPLSDSDETQDDSDEEDDQEDVRFGDHQDLNGQPFHHMFEDEEEEDGEEDDEEDIFFVDAGGERPEPLGVAPAEVANEGLNEANVPVNGNGGQPVEMGAAGAIDGNEELDGNVEDDMEGAMEAIGMRGPILGVFQNAALMVFVLDTAIGVCIWIPFTVGKTAALLTLDPQRMLQILHLPIRAMRLVTDPVVDSVAYIITRFFLPPWLQLLRKTGQLIGLLSSSLASKVLGADVVDKISQFSTGVYDQSIDLIDKPLSRITGLFHSAGVPEPTTMVQPDHLFPEYAQFLEPFFIQVGRTSRLVGSHIQETWNRLALGSGPGERVFAVVLGYAIFSLILALYLNVLTVGNARTAGRAVRNAIRQQLLVTKVAAFIFIELVLFPLGCGVVLDGCTVWLFLEANVQSRVAFFTQAPLTATFYHWIAGTMFMYSFAILLSGCRSVMRPGAMWFIKDPQDQNSHPIRDILERPTVTQLRKIGVSGIMYSIVVAAVVGSVAGLLVLGSKSIMPFRWKNREPLSNVPVDLLFLHLLLPQTIHSFRPKRGMKHLATIIWRYIAARLRLTSYFFGGRYPSEEFSSGGWSILWGPESSDRIPNGTFRRVPATDNLALGRDMRATAEVTEHGVPVSEESKKLIEQQDAEALKARRDVTKDYTIVYIPPLFRYRIILFILQLWMVGAILLGVAVALPIQLGRSFFGLFTTRHVHDGYALLAGFYLLWACYLVGKAIDRLDKRRQRVRFGDGPRADLRVLVLKRGLLWAAKMIYMAILLGVVIPVLVAVVIDLYIVLPIRVSMNPGMTPRIRVVDAWALGLLYGKIALHVTQIHPPNQVTRGLQHILSNGWVRPDPMTATREVIAPLVGGLLGMIVFPAFVLQVVRYLFPALLVDTKFIFMNVYPAIFMVAGLLRSSVVLYDILSTWSQSIRDTEFLVELRLKNHETLKEKPLDSEARVDQEAHRHIN